MKKFFRAVTFVLFVGGWALASSALYVVRTPSKVLIFPKNQLGYHDTYVDTRTWTLTEDREHKDLIARIIQVGKSQDMSHTVNSALGPTEVQLAAVAASPAVATSTDTSLTDKAKAEIKNVGDTIKSKVN